MAEYKFRCGNNSNHIFTLSQMCRICPTCGGIGTAKPILESIVTELEKEIIESETN